MSPRNPSARRLVGFSAASPMGLNDSSRQNVSDQFWRPSACPLTLRQSWPQHRGGSVAAAVNLRW